MDLSLMLGKCKIDPYLKSNGVKSIKQKSYSGPLTWAP